MANYITKNLQMVVGDTESFGFELSDSQVAFRNGVYDFKLNKWLFKYTIITLPALCNKLYIYNSQYVIHWYFNFDFEPLDIDINDFSLEEFIDIIKEINENEKNYCFELLYNMSFDIIILI